MMNLVAGRPSRRNDPLERVIEIALEPGRFISYRSSFAFVSDLDQVTRKIEALIRSDPRRAVSLSEIFLAGAYEKAEEIDDSDGSFGDLVGKLFCNWVRARQASAEDPDETAALVLARMDNDPYGFTYGIERELAKAFNKGGRAAFEQLVSARFEQAAAAEKSGRSSTYESRHWADVLRALHVAQHATVKYVALCERTGVSPDDCEAIARMLQAKRKTEEALSWVERGIVLQRERGSASRGNLLELKRALLAKSGRSADALRSAWEEFHEDPNRYTYESLMRYVPKSDKKAWHEKAMASAEKGDLAGIVELWLETGETERLVQRLRVTTDTALEKLSHYVSEPAAAELEKKYPGVAARLYRAIGMRILEAKKSRYYAAALQHFGHARECYRRAGLGEAWDSLIAQIREAHHRKSAFISGFERIACGGEDREEGFLERARKRWSPSHRR